MKTKFLLILLCLLTATPAADSQQTFRILQGYVTDARLGDQILGASILVKGTTIGTATNVQGYFKLDIPTGEQVLNCWYMGCVTQEIALTADRDTVNFALEQEKVLEEPVVISLDYQPKRLILGGSTSTNKDSIQNNKND